MYHKSEKILTGTQRCQRTWSLNKMNGNLASRQLNFKRELKFNLCSHHLPHSTPLNLQSIIIWDQKPLNLHSTSYDMGPEYGTPLTVLHISCPILHYPTRMRKWQMKQRSNTIDLQGSLWYSWLQTSLGSWSCN